MTLDMLAGSWLSWEGDLVQKSLIVLALTLATAVTVSRRSASIRHLVWRCLIVALAILPLVSGGLQGVQVNSWPTVSIPTPLDRPVPVMPLMMPQSTAHVAPKPAPITTSTPRHVVDKPALAPVSIASIARISRLAAPSPLQYLPTALLCLWLLGAVVSFAQTLIGLISLLWLTRRCQIASPSMMVVAQSIGRDFTLPVPVTAQLLIAPVGVFEMPMTYGALEPCVVLPSTAEQWPAERLQAVLRHELAHVARRDWPFQIIARVVCGLYWFNPLIWYAARKLRLEADIACDDIAVSAMRPAAYAEALFGLASDRRAGFAMALPMAAAGQLELRLRSIASSTNARTQASMASTIVSGIITAIAAFAIAGIHRPAPIPPLSLTLPPGPSIAEKMAGRVPVRLVSAEWTPLTNSGAGLAPERSFDAKVVLPRAIQSHDYWFTDNQGRRMQTLTGESSFIESPMGNTLDVNVRGLDPTCGPIHLIVQPKDTGTPEHADGSLPAETLDFGMLPVPTFGSPVIVNRSMTTRSGGLLRLRKLVVEKPSMVANSVIAVIARYTAPSSRPDMRALSYQVEMTDDSGRDLVKSNTSYTVNDPELLTGMGSGSLVMNSNNPPTPTAHGVHVIIQITEAADSLKQPQHLQTASFQFDPIKLPGASASDPSKKPFETVRTDDVVAHLKSASKYSEPESFPGGRTYTSEGYYLLFDVDGLGRRAKNSSLITSMFVTEPTRGVENEMTGWDDMWTYWPCNWHENGSAVRVPYTMHQASCSVMPLPAVDKPFAVSFDVQMTRRSTAQMSFWVPSPAIGRTIPINRTVVDPAGHRWRIVDVTAFGPSTPLTEFNQSGIPSLTESYGVVVTVAPPDQMLWNERRNQAQTAVDDRGSELPYQSTLQTAYSRGHVANDGYVFAPPKPSVKRINVSLLWDEYTPDGKPVSLTFTNIRPTTN